MKNKVEKTYSDLFGTAPDFIVRAPGRINLIGEHTDYNLGLVFPAAIDKCMYFAFGVNNVDTYNLVAGDLQESTAIKPLEFIKSDLLWVNYLTGVLQQFYLRNIIIPGFNCAFMSEIPIGAGLSSSAALDCGFAKGLDHMAQSGLSDWEVAQIGHYSDNQFLGINSGILDQFSSVFGRQNKAMLMDCRDLSFQYVDMDLEGYRWTLIDTNVKHNNLSSGYNDRPTECQLVVSLLSKEDPAIKSLRDVSEEFLAGAKNLLSDILYNRAQFILSENKRVKLFKSALDNNDVTTLGQLLYESHNGLQYLYEVSCFELDLLVDLTREKDEVAGARMMGGGFGGCTLNLVKSADAGEVIHDITEEYYNKTELRAEVYNVHIGDGVKIERI